MSTTVETVNSRVSRRVFSISIGAALVVALVSLALVFASAGSTRRVADNARDLHWTNAVVGTAALVRAANAQAVFFAVDHAIGVASEESTIRAQQEATSTVEALRLLAESPPREEFVGRGSLERLIASSDQVIDLIASGEVNSALELNRTEVEAAFTELGQIFSDQREDLLERIEGSEGSAGRLSTLSQVLVTLLIPLTALIIYRIIVKRQVREHNIQSEAKLEAERDLNRAKDEFIAGLSHEFRTPLTSIYGFSEVLLESGMIDPSSSMELIGLINTESTELSRMVDDLLVAARLEADALSFKMEEVQIADEVETVLAPWMRTGHEIHIEMPTSTVLVDPLRLRQVLRNLVSNAIKHGGPRIGVWGRTDGQDLVCSVVDNGPGVPDEIAGRLFNRFVHEGREALLAGSVGLGLNIARSLVVAMSGDLVYERIDDTTWFTFRLPLAHPHAGRTEPRVELPTDFLVR
jgi:signal transduction histidine kinase